MPRVKGAATTTISTRGPVIVKERWEAHVRALGQVPAKRLLALILADLDAAAVTPDPPTQTRSIVQQITDAAPTAHRHHPSTTVVEEKYEDGQHLVRYACTGCDTVLSWRKATVPA